MIKLFCSWDEVYAATHSLIEQVNASGWQPEYIVAINRGGLIPATLMSYRMAIPLKPLMIGFETDDECVSDCAMAEDAFGHNLSQPRNILVVDDSTITGTTFNWLKQDWQSNCYPAATRWPTIWHKNVKFATLVKTNNSPYVDFTTQTIDQNTTVVFPWEVW
jgi:hypoxanthine phosphoribosyltransferase